MQARSEHAEATTEPPLPPSAHADVFLARKEPPPAAWWRVP